MIADYTIYDAATGRPSQVGRSETDYLDVPPGHVVLIGTRVEDGQWVDPATGWIVPAPPLPDPAPARVSQISPRQMILGLYGQGFITADEALAAATSGAVPAAVDAVISALPAHAEVAARVTWARMSVVLRDDPLVGLLAASQGLSSAEVDAFFAACAAL